MAASQPELRGDARIHDIIGDVHGHADRLEALLLKLGYAHRHGAWRHPERTAIFVGDLIDRGPEQLRTLGVVRDMIEAGSAQAVMGNHELNAIGFATPDPSRPGEFLRRRSAKTEHQHAAFLAAVGEGSAEHDRWIDWFLALPLWIETPQLRVVHACWDAHVVGTAQPWLRGSTWLPHDVLVLAFQAGHPLHACVEFLLKGPEVELPVGASFTDKDGHVRTAIRTRWWVPELQTFAAAYIGPADADIPAVPLPDIAALSSPDRPTFIGHYWLDPQDGPTLLSRRVACVDYSVANGGLMTAYRFDGETVLTPEHFVWV